MDKIKAFFQNKVTQIVAWSILVLDVIALFIGGVTEGEINNGVALTISIIGAVSTLIAFICSKISKK